jgi:hypothetical protein
VVEEMKLRLFVLEDDQPPNPANINMGISADIYLTKYEWQVFDSDFDATGIWGRGEDKNSAIIDFLRNKFA